MSDNLLILHPSDPRAAPEDPAAFVQALRSIGFIGEEFDYFGDLHYRPGPRFHELIRFVSSHTVVILEPADGKLKETERRDSRELCHVQIPQATPEEEFRGGAYTEPPLCPNCGFLLEEWVDMLDEWYGKKSSYRWQCPRCSSQYSPSELDWQHTAAIVRFVIRIWRIRYGEAYPSDDLMSFLSSQLADSWNYFYYSI